MELVKDIVPDSVPPEKRDIVRKHLEEKLYAFTLHDFRQENYELIKGWWTSRNYPAAMYEHLPPNGIIICLQGKAVCAGFLFLTDANLAVIGNLVSDPNVPKEVRQPSIDFLIKFLSSRAKDKGYTLVCCSTNIPKLQKRFEDLGFIKTDENVSQFARRV